MIQWQRNPSISNRRFVVVRCAYAILLGMVCTDVLDATARDTRAADGPRSPATASDEAASAPPTTLEQQEPLDPARLIGRTVELMRTAQQRLEANQLDDETGRLQRQIEDQLGRLLKLAEQQAAQRAQIMPEEQPPDSPAPNSSATGGTGAQQSQSAQAGESSEPPRAGDEMTQDEVQRRKNLATAVWGHLPPRLRDRMHGAFSERFLPQYDDLVRSYYEALATQGEPRQ
jgi:hypothetical protein